MKALTRFEEHFRTWSVVLAGAVMVCVCDGGVKLHVNVCACMRACIHVCNNIPHGVVSVQAHSGHRQLL